jgi:transcriptional regulator with XRE-family HTH domain
VKLFAERLRELRKSKGLTQVDMAKLLHCTKQHYQRIEYGKINIPTLTLIELARFFHTSTDWICGLTNNPVFHPDEDADTLEATAV